MDGKLAQHVGLFFIHFYLKGKRKVLGNEKFKRKNKGFW
jgi:hypothetical protein